MTKAGNGYMRTMAIEIARGWVRLQPQSTLTQWYQARLGQGSARLRKIEIVVSALSGFDVVLPRLCLALLFLFECEASPFIRSAPSPD